MKRFFLLFGCLVLLAGCEGKSKSLTLTSPDGQKTIAVKVEVADTPGERERGLQYRKDLPENEGMLFVFPRPEQVKFWMLNTVTSLDVLYFDPEGKFIAAYEMDPCKTDPCPTYPSPELTVYALEFPKGFRKKNGIGLGWMMDIEKAKKVSSPR